MGHKYNLPLTDLPINLTNLTLHSMYEYELPYQIKYLKLINNLKLIDNLPDSIEELEIDSRLQLELINLPSSIKKLKLNCKNINLIILPKSIEYLKIYKKISLDNLTSSLLKFISIELAVIIL